MITKKPIDKLTHYELQCESDRIKKNISEFVKMCESQKTEDLTIEQIKTRIDEMRKIFIEDQAFMTGMSDMAAQKKLSNVELLNLKNTVDELVKNIESLQAKCNSL